MVRKGLEAVNKADRQFNYFLKELQRSRKVKRRLNSAVKEKHKKNGVDEHFLKVLEKKQKAIQEDVTNQQLKYFVTLRDRKVAFINKM